LKADAMNPTQKVKQSLALIVIMSISIGFLVAYGIDDWIDGHTIKYVGRGLLALGFLGAVLLHARVICGLIR
jgi:hypothetical protein